MSHATAYIGKMQQDQIALFQGLQAQQKTLTAAKQGLTALFEKNHALQEQIAKQQTLNAENKERRNLELSAKVVELQKLKGRLQAILDQLEQASLPHPVADLVGEAEWQLCGYYGSAHSDQVYVGAKP